MFLTRLGILLTIANPSLGQVGGVAISAAVFQSILNSELHKRIHTPDAEKVRMNALLGFSLHD